MDAISDPLVNKLIAVAPSQVAKTELLLNGIGWVVDVDPSPILFVTDTVEHGRSFSKKRLNTMFRDTPCLRGKLETANTHNSDNTILEKIFPGGSINIVGSNSPGGLSSNPIKYAFCDEAGRWAVSAGKEGDQFELIGKRLSNYPGSKFIAVSSPSTEGECRITEELKLSDYRIWEIPCPSCGKLHVMDLKDLEWEKNSDNQVLVDSVHHVCKECGFITEEQGRVSFLASGKWRATRDFNGVAGFDIGMISPWVPWHVLAQEFTDSYNNIEKLKVFMNTREGKPFAEKGDAPEWKVLKEKSEKYERNIIPSGGSLLVSGVDIQKNRIELEIVAYGKGLESWSIDYRVLPGDPSKPEVWELLRLILMENFKHEDGGQTQIRMMAVDSGYNTHKAYAFGRLIGADRAMIVRDARTNKTILCRPKAVDINYDGKTVAKGVNLWGLGTDILKNELYSFFRLDQPTDGKEYPPGYCHFPNYEKEFFKQITGEALKRIGTSNGIPIRAYRKTRKRQEGLLCRVYARAAAALLQVDRYSDQDWETLEQMIVNNVGIQQTQTGQRRKGSPGITV